MNGWMGDYIDYTSNVIGVMITLITSDYIDYKCAARCVV